MPSASISQTAASLAAPHDGVGAGASSADILVVDDYQENLLAMEVILQGLGRRIVLANSGAEALKRLLAQDFAVILLDVQMPEMDGFETAELIRGRQRSRHTPIIFVTAHDRTEAALARGYRIGAVDFLFKPIVPEILRSKTAVFVELFEQREAIQRAAEQLRLAEQREREQRMDAERQRWESERIRQEIQTERAHVAELNRRATQLAEARRAAEVASAAKSQFLANVSHELRTPLNAVIGYSEMLEEECNDLGLPQLVPDLRQIQSAGRHLLALVNDILDLSKVEAGRIELFLETFDVCEVVNDVAVTVQPLVTKANNRLEVRCAAAEVGKMHADVTKLRQSLFNLLSNAAKFTKDGHITVEVHREAGDAVVGPDRIVFRVRDTGVGIRPQQMERLFQPFMQGDASTGRDYGGTGLGLAITKRFCEIMGGGVSVVSTPGAGATFTITLPVVVAPTLMSVVREAEPQADVEPAVIVPAEDDSNLADGAPRPVVLVIDDDAPAREVTRRVLTRAGYRVQTAADGETGLRLARSLRPDAILLDVLMPGVDGWAVLGAIKSDAELADIPVIMCTMTTDRGLGFAAGAAEFLSKPVERNRLVSVLQRFTRERSETAPPCRVLLVDDDPVSVRSIRAMLDDFGCEIEDAPDGRAALERIEQSSAPPPDLILLDLMMPHMDGFEFAAVLHANPAWRSIPVAVMTAKDLTAEDRARLNGYVTKVVQKGSDGSRLLAALRDILAGAVPVDVNAVR